MKNVLLHTIFFAIWLALTPLAVVLLSAVALVRYAQGYEARIYWTYDFGYRF